MNYSAYHFIVEPAHPGSEILIAMIAEFGFESFDSLDNGFIAYIPAELSSAVDLQEFEFPDFTFSYTIQHIEKQNWNEEWEKNFEPVIVKDLVCIRAPFHAPEPSVKFEIVIMPKMSFGTGHHQTTQLMCEAMFGFDFKNTRVLDMGCGTGVLAILAKKSGATDLLAIDIDEWSVENSIENCAANGAADIAVKKGDVDLLEKEEPFDFILANINKNILKKQISAYSKILKREGKLFLSGFFKTDAQELILEGEKVNLKLHGQNSKDEWTMLVLEKL